jgi:hypothetical protein
MPDDVELFAEAHQGPLRSAVEDLAWLLSRGYAEASALKLVGDRHGLVARQQLGVRRAACSDAALARRLRASGDAAPSKSVHVHLRALPGSGRRDRDDLPPCPRLDQGLTEPADPDTLEELLLRGRPTACCPQAERALVTASSGLAAR